METGFRSHMLAWGYIALTFGTHLHSGLGAVRDLVQKSGALFFTRDFKGPDIHVGHGLAICGLVSIKEKPTKCGPASASPPKIWTLYNYKMNFVVVVVPRQSKCIVLILGTAPPVSAFV